MKKQKADENAKKEPLVRICQECGKEILPGEPAEYILTKRRTQIWIHKRCIGGVGG